MVKNLNYNIAQLAFILLRAVFTVLEFGRGTGKSTIIGKQIIDCVTQMPRSTGILVAETFIQIKTRTLPSTIAGMEMHGYYEDIHFVIGKKPPASYKWPKPFQRQTDFKNTITFWNGTTIVMVSQDGSAGSGRGLNGDWVIGDEAALLDKKKFDNEVILSNRGNERCIAEYPDGTWKYFHECELHHSVLLATSTPTTTAGMWVLEYEQLAIDQPEKYAFLRASAELNRENLGDEWFKMCRDTLPDFIYAAEIENKRISKIDNGFYPKLNETLHTYLSYNTDYYQSITNGKKITCEGDTDLDMDAPLIGAIDWGSNINCMLVAQVHGIEHRMLKNLYVKNPKIIDDLILEEFIPYYAAHRNKKLYLWYDPTGNNSLVNSRKTLAEGVKDMLEKHGWKVQLMTKAKVNEKHELKYALVNKLLQEVDQPKVILRFNKNNCRELWISMTNAPAMRGRTEAIKKDKRSEKNKNINQAHATHFSDAFDIMVCGMYMGSVLIATKRKYRSVSYR